MTFKEWIQKQNLQDYGTLILGLTGAFALFFSNDILDKITKVHTISEEVRALASEIKTISKNLEITLKAIDENLKKERAEDLAKQITEQENKLTVPQILESLPEKPDLNSSTTQIYMLNQDKQKVESALSSMNLNSASAQEAAKSIIMGNLAVYNPVSNPIYSAVIKHAGSPAFKTTDKSDLSWIMSVQAPTPTTVILRFKKDFFRSKPTCFCTPSKGIRSCFIKDLENNKIRLEIAGEYTSNPSSINGEFEVSCYK